MYKAFVGLTILIALVIVLLQSFFKGGAQIICPIMKNVIILYIMGWKTHQIMMPPRIMIQDAKKKF